MGGMAGNKGGIAARFDWCDTSFCFVTAHFAAGNIFSLNQKIFRSNGCC